jgi:hypothetical protein
VKSPHLVNWAESEKTERDIMIGNKLVKIWMAVGSTVAFSTIIAGCPLEDLPGTVGENVGSDAGIISAGQQGSLDVPSDTGGRSGSVRPGRTNDDDSGIPDEREAAGKSGSAGKNGKSCDGTRSGRAGEGASTGMDSENGAARSGTGRHHISGNQSSAGRSANEGAGGSIPGRSMPCGSMQSGSMSSGSMSGCRPSDSSNSDSANQGAAGLPSH